MTCRGSFTSPTRVHPETGAGECGVYTKRFDKDQLVTTPYRSQVTGRVSRLGPYVPKHNDTGGTP